MSEPFFTPEEEQGFAPIDLLLAKKTRAKETALLMRKVREGNLFIEGVSSPHPWLDTYKGKLCLKRTANACKMIDRQLERLLHTPSKQINIFKEDKELEVAQNKAVQTALHSSLTVIAGGPGTGKTFTAKKIIEQIPSDHKIAIAAPTGKATERLRSKLATTMFASTLHKLLHNATLLPYDVLLVDEASMIDVEMMARLLSSIKPGAHLILLGDPNQLPPVEGGDPFAQMVDDKRISSVILTECRRTDHPEILALAEAVRIGDFEQTIELLQKNLQPLPTPTELTNLLDPQSECILTPLRQGPHGSDALNALFHKTATDPRPILITRNDPTLELFNGDQGFLEGELAFFEGRDPIPLHMLPPFGWRYVLSVHKSQGSEAPFVTLLLPEGSERFGRKMLYTAITRAQKKVRLFGETHLLQKCLETL